MFGAHKSAKSMNQKQNLDALVKSLFQDDYLLLKRSVIFEKLQLLSIHFACSIAGQTRAIPRTTPGYLISEMCKTQSRSEGNTEIVYHSKNNSFASFNELLQEGLSRFGARFSFVSLFQMQSFPFPVVLFLWLSLLGFYGPLCERGARTLHLIFIALLFYHEHVWLFLVSCENNTRWVLSTA